MDQLYAGINVLLEYLLGLSEFFFGCSHRRTSFPMTLRASVGVNGGTRTQLETGIVCLDCAGRFSYDWATMRRGKLSHARVLITRFTATGFHTSALNNAGGVAAMAKP
jgi:hypothetical protein